MAAIKRTKTSKCYSIVFRPFRGGQIWVATDERNKKNALAIEEELLFACRSNEYFHLSDEAKIVCVRMFCNKGWQLPEVLADEFLSDRPVDPPEPVMSIQRGIASFLEYPEIKRAKSFERYRFAIKHLERYFDHRYDMAMLDIPTLKQYRIDREDEGAAPATINWEIGTLSKIFQVLIELKALSTNPCRDLKSLSQRDGERDAYIGHSDFQKMLCNVADWFRPIIQCSYYTGMRRNEIVELEKSQVIFEKRIMTIKLGQTKEYHWKRIPICRELEPILRAAIDMTDSNCKWVFTVNGHKTNAESFKRQWRNAISMLELKPRFHDLRATWRVNARNSGIEDELRKAIMGHGTRTREVTERYGRILDAELVQAIDKMKYDFGPTIILTAK